MIGNLMFREWELFQVSVAGKELVSTRSNEFCRVQLTSSIELVPEIGGQSDSCISWVIIYRTSRNFGRMRLRRSLPALAKHVKYDQSTIRSHEYSQLASCIKFNSTRLTWSSWRAWQASRVRNEFNSTCQQHYSRLLAICSHSLALELWSK